MNVLLLILVFLGSALIQVFIGGMRPVFAIPGYLILGVAGILSFFMLRKNRPMPSSVCMVSSLLFFSYILARAYLSPVEYLSRPDRYMVLACLIVYFLFAFYLIDAKHRIWLFYGFFALALGHIIIGFIQFIEGNNYLPFDYLRADYGRRASGFYVCPNHFAGLLEMLGVMAASIGLWSRVGIKSRMLVLYFTAVALAGIAISGSRGGYLSTAITFTFLAVVSVAIVRVVLPNRTILLGSVSILILALIGIGGVVAMKKSDLLASRVHNVFEKKNMRYQLWDAALRQYKSQPVTGTGAGTYYYLGRYYRDPSVNSDPVWVHNDYYHLLAEYGWMGAALCAFFLGSHLWQGFSACRAIIQKRLKDRNQATSNALALNVGALAAIVAILAHSVVDFNVHIVGNALLLAVLFGILANPPIQRTRKNEDFPLLALSLRLLIPMCALVIFVDAAPHLQGEWRAERARVALRDAKFMTAIRESQKGLEVEKTNPDLHFYLGEARRLFGNRMTSEIARQKMNEAALGAFRNSIQIFPQDEKVWVKMSQSLDLIGKPDEALDYLDKARALDPHLDAINIFYGAHYQLIGDNDTALKFYNKAQQHETARKGRTEVMNQIKSDGGR